jgi:uncharacterized protein (TIGR00369 family)
MDPSELRALVENITARPGHMSAMGTRVVVVEPGHVHLAIDRRPDLLQFSGHFHGGVTAALADHAAGGAVTTALAPGRIAVTIDLHVNFLAPANGAVLNAKSQSCSGRLDHRRRASRSQHKRRRHRADVRGGAGDAAGGRNQERRKKRFMTALRSGALSEKARSIVWVSPGDHGQTKR